MKRLCIVCGKVEGAVGTPDEEVVLGCCEELCILKFRNREEFQGAATAYQYLVTSTN